MRFSKTFQKVLPFIGIVILVVLIKKADFSEVFLSMKSADYQYFFPVILVVFLSLALNTFKWSILVKKQGIKIGFLKLVKFNLIGQFYGVITPGRLGNLVRINYLKEYTQKSYSQSSASVILDRLIDLIGLLILSLLGILIFTRHLPMNFIYLNIGLLLLLLISVLFIINQRWNRRLLKFLYQKLAPEKYKESLKSAYYSLYQNFPSQKDFLFVVLLSLFFWLILISGSYLIARSIDIEVGWLYFGGALSISGIVSLLPISISGWGTREAALVVLLAPFNVSIERILTFSLLNFFFFSVVSAMIGAVFLTFRKQ